SKIPSEFVLCYCRRFPQEYIHYYTKVLTALSSHLFPLPNLHKRSLCSQDLTGPIFVNRINRISEIPVTRVLLSHHTHSHSFLIQIVWRGLCQFGNKKRPSPPSLLSFGIYLDNHFAPHLLPFLSA